MKTMYVVLEQPFASENFKKVEVMCQDVDQRVHAIVKSLSTYGIPFEKIHVRQTNKLSECKLTVLHASYLFYLYSLHISVKAISMSSETIGKI
jgi:hypothetical protein